MIELVEIRGFEELGPLPVIELVEIQGFEELGPLPVIELVEIQGFDKLNHRAWVSAQRCRL